MSGTSESTSNGTHVFTPKSNLSLPKLVQQDSEGLIRIIPTLSPSFQEMIQFHGHQMDLSSIKVLHQSMKGSQTHTRLVEQLLDKATDIPSGQGHIQFNFYFLHVIDVFQVSVTLFTL